MALVCHTTLATWVYAIYRTLREEGVDADKILAKCDISLGELNAGQQPLPKEKVNKFWQFAVDATGNDAICLKVLNNISDPSINALITSAQASQDINHALQLLLRYYKILSVGTRLTVETDNELKIIMTGASSTPDVANENVDLAFGLILKHGSALSIQHVKPTRVLLTRPVPNQREKYQNFYDCPISFNADQNMLCFPAKVLEAPIAGANQILSTHIEQYLAGQALETDARQIEQHVHAALLTMLPHGTPKLSSLAKQLNMSERTLQRKLKSENICYKDMLSQIRIQLAKSYLENKRYPVQEVSDRLGFTEPSNFVRFFKQQLGVTPGEFGV